ncbi:hypothetical protein DFH06DRAFT_1201941 [Mycena polygramma]|nr:hypothetical protein DFH06DRAFT_1201941 [Mycena polygramma]
MHTEYSGEQPRIRQTLRNFGSYRDIPSKSQHISRCPLDFAAQTSEQCEAKFDPHLLPVVPHRDRFPSTHSIYTTFASYVTWLIQIVFLWRRGTPRKQDTMPTRMSPIPNLDPLHAAQDPVEQWKLRMLLARRKKEAERACRNPNVIMAFTGLPVPVADLLSSGGAEKRKWDELSEDEDQPAELPWQPHFPAPSPCPLSPMSPHYTCSSLREPEAPSSQEKYIFPSFDWHIRSRCTSPGCSSADSVWSRDEFPDEQPENTSSRCTSPFLAEDCSEDDSDSEIQECVTLMFEED